ncbi:MAG: ATP-binding protein [Deltaproteobacteria bacterium]|nr:ATP-binding protein [Deltaproteobacteria bacterium]
MIVAVASGKGGTGKTTVSINLAVALGSEVQLLDCDVEEPNVSLFLSGSLDSVEVVTTKVPEVDETLCDACGECGLFCRFHAIVSLETKPLVFPELCHACGGCSLVCPRQAIREVERRIGDIETTRCGEISVVRGQLDVGVAMSPPLIRAVKARSRKDALVIVDAPPGVSCPVIAAISGADYVILVTEPTPFGLNDLALAVAMVREIKLPFGVVINRVGIGDDRVHRFCQENDIPVLLELPDDRRVAEAYSKGIAAVKALPQYRKHFQHLLDTCLETIRGSGG